MNIVLIGIQGSGKGTLVACLEKHIKFSLISMGQLLRDEIATGSSLGQEIKRVIDAGNLVSTEIAMSTLEKKLKEDENPIKIFDGFPRNLVQSNELDKIAKIDLVVHLDLDKEVAINRLLNRLTCTKCGYVTRKSAVDSLVCPECSGQLAQRADDNMESIAKRFSVFENDTFPLLDKYKKQGVRILKVDASDADKVLNTVLKVLNEYNY